MKELAGTAVNFSLVSLTEADGAKLRAFAEIVIVRSEPAYFLDSGLLKHRRVTDEVRVGMTADGLRELATRFAEWADDMEVLEARATLAAKENDEPLR